MDNKQTYATTKTEFSKEGYLKFLDILEKQEIKEEYTFFYEQRWGNRFYPILPIYLTQS